jgi:pyridoxamine 5'-phosphate oxidase
MKLTILNEDPLQKFEEWLQTAIDSGIKDATAMTLATVFENQPSARTVLLKKYDHHGFIFYTNYATSKKSRDIKQNPAVALLFYWPILNRQIRIEGSIKKTKPEESDQYFQTRPRGSQISAWVSQQSQVLADPNQLQDDFIACEKKFAESLIPRPAHWGAYCVEPHYFEFWEARDNRLHHRVAFKRNSQNEWRHFYLNP